MSAASVVISMLTLSGYSWDDLRSHEKHDRRLVDLRKRVIHALRAAGHSTPEIGRLVNRDHTTVLDTLRQPVPR
jgi:chromosomal replication initiation ATPase DnaA